MLGFAWLTLRQAQEALKAGRLEDAQRLLSQPPAQGHKRSWPLLQQLASAFVERGERQLRHDDDEAAWTDLLRAEQVSAEAGSAERLRQALTRLGLAQVRALLAGGEPARAAELLAQLRERKVRHTEVQPLEEAARNWLLARELADRGEFTRALEAIDQARRVLPGADGGLVQFRAEVDSRHQTAGPLLVQLHEAVAAGRWQEVVDLSQRVLTAAPQHREARRARDLAWKAVVPVTVAAAADGRPAAGFKGQEHEPPLRFLLWIDGVGGYLVCLGTQIALGQATPDAFVDVPLFADVSRMHATLTRDGEGWLIQAVRSVKVNSQTTDHALLRHNDRVTLGPSCQFLFRQPSPVSGTARLELVSGHRLPWAVEGVILMADTLLLGPGTQVHIPMPDLKQPLILFRHKDGLGVRCPGKMMVNGEKSEGRALLGPTAAVVGDDFSLALEPVLVGGG